MQVTVFLHEIDTDAHPTIPPGWRWAVHLGGNPHDLKTCLNGGWCPNEREASLEGETVGVAVAKGVTLVSGHKPEYRVQVLAADPIVAGADRIDPGLRRV